MNPSATKPNGTAELEHEPESPKRSFRKGIQAVLPLLPGLIPFAMITGSSAVEAGISKAGAVAMSLVIFAGASQLVMVEMWEQEAPALVLLATVLLVNLRFVMYSATLAPYLRGVARTIKPVMAYAMTDQATLLSLPEFAKDARSAKWFFLGGTVTLWSFWQVSTWAGVFLGSRLPASWSLSFAVPLSFLALLIPTLTDKKMVIVAFTSAGAVLLTRLLPFNLGLIAACLIGVGVGMFLDRKA